MEKKDLATLQGRARRKEIKMRMQPSSVLNLDENEDHVEVAKLVESRRDELDKMLAVIKAPPAVRTSLQRISRAKRRRAAAHDKRRLPAYIGTEIATKSETKTKRRRKVERKLEINGQAATERDGGQLSANRWFARRFHMVEQFGWRLPLAPTEKKLQLMMNIAQGRYDGLLVFDHSFISVYNDNTCRHPTQDKRQMESTELGAKFVVIGAKKDEFFRTKTELTLQGVTFDIEVKEVQPYLEVYCRPEHTTKLLTLVNTTSKGHIGGLEVWNLHRCSLGHLTFPNDFPETPQGRSWFKGELQRMTTKSKRTPKAKDKHVNVKLTANVNTLGMMATPPGVRISSSEGLIKKRLVCEGRGRLERFAVLSLPDEQSEVERNALTGNDEQRYSVLEDAEPISGERETIGFVTSVSQSGALGCTVGVGTIKNGSIPSRLFYRNLHWKHWRVCRVESLSSEAVYF